MAKGLVEKYQQILESDPGSLVFVELAKALLDTGKAKAAAEICAKGLEHHPDSVVGRVLWGKALINCGRPAEAMDQFDKAVAIDRENPSAYNLIGEVLLHKGLFRSAVPILKKAVALQPTDARVRQWLDQAQRGVKGGPATGATAQTDHTTVDVKGQAQAEPTVVDTKAYIPPGPAPAPGLAPINVPAAPAPKPGDELEPGPETMRGISGVFQALGGRGNSGQHDLNPNPDGPSTQVMPPSVQAMLATAAAPAAKPGEAPPEEKKEEVPWLETPSAHQAEGTTQPLKAMPAEVAAAAPAQPGPTPEELAAAEAEKLKNVDVVPGLTGVFQSLAARAQEIAATPPGAEALAPPAPAESPAPAEPPRPAEELAPPAPQPAAAPEAPPAPEPPPAADAAAPPAPAPAPKSGGLLPELDLLPPDDEGSSREPTQPAAQLRRVPGVPPPPPKLTPEETVQVSADLGNRTASGRDRLLPDLPSMPPTSLQTSDEMPSVVIAPEAAADIAREYERELREKMLATPPPTFLRKNWLPLSVCAALIVASGVGYAIYRATRLQNRGSDLIELRSKSFRALALATPAGYRDAIDLAEQALGQGADKDCESAHAFANAALFRYFGLEPGRKTAAEKYLPSAQDKHPGLALAIPYLLATDPGALEAAKAPLLAAQPKDLPTGFETAEVHSLVGRLLMSVGKTEEALARFKSALDADQSHVATLVALGDYYLSQSEFDQALKWLSLARQVSPDHVPAAMGAARAKLELGGEDPAPDLEAALKAYRGPEGGQPLWPRGLQVDLDLIEGRVLAQQGKMADAASKLSSGASEHPDRAADFFSALGSIQAFAGNYDQAETAYKKAVEKQKNDLTLREELARVYVARGKYAEALKVTDVNSGDDRRLKIVRGRARLELGQFAKAKEELQATARSGKFPVEAAIYLAMADVGLGQKDPALRVLPDAAKKASRGKSAAHVALGRLLLDEGKEPEAIAQFTAAMADRRDWEGACSLGRLHLKASRFADARTNLATAVERNKFHLEARLAYGQALLALGEAGKAQAEFEAALALSPSAGVHRGIARAMLALGDLNGARSHLSSALKMDPKDPETGRLSAQLALAAGDAQEALKSLEKATKANPRDPVAWCELGETLVKVGNNGRAAAAFDVALKNDRGNPRARDRKSVV